MSTTTNQSVHLCTDPELDEETIAMLRQRRADIDREQTEDGDAVIRELRNSFPKPRS